jgi:hypothetical protein
MEGKFLQNLERLVSWFRVKIADQDYWYFRFLAIQLRNELC